MAKIKELKEVLETAGVEFDPKATKPELEALVEGLLSDEVDEVQEEAPEVEVLEVSAEKPRMLEDKRIILSERPMIINGKEYVEVSCADGTKAILPLE